MSEKWDLSEECYIHQTETRSVGEVRNAPTMDEIVGERSNAPTMDEMCRRCALSEKGVVGEVSRPLLSCVDTVLYIKTIAAH